MHLTVKIDFNLCSISELEQIISECQTILRNKILPKLTEDEARMLFKPCKEGLAMDRITVIKMVRERTLCSLRDAVDAVRRAEAASPFVPG